MVRTQEPGTPFPFGRAMKPDLVVIEAGDYENEEGMKVVLSDTNLVIMGAFGGTQVTLGIDIHDLLEAIQKHTRENES